MATRWWMTASHRYKPPRRKRIRWDLLGLQGPVTDRSIDEIRRQMISASHRGLSPETMARSQRTDRSRQSVATKAGSTAIRKERIQKPEPKDLPSKGRYSHWATQQMANAVTYKGLAKPGLPLGIISEEHLGGSSTLRGNHA